MPKVSVIIPCYNQGKYIDEAVDSVLNQTFQNFEIVIVNDGSTDEYTNNLLENYNKPKTKVIHTENRGVSAARNTAIYNSSGEYILPLDADDKIEETYLEKAVKILDENSDVKVVTINTIMFGNENRFFYLPPFSFSELLWHNLLVVSSLFRKEDFYKTEGYNKEMKDGFEDWEFWIRFIKTVKGKVYRINENLFYYRINPDSRTKTANEKEKILTSQIVKNNPEIYYYYYSKIYKEYSKLKNQLNLILNSKSYKISKSLFSQLNLLRKWLKL